MIKTTSKLLGLFLFLLLASACRPAAQQTPITTNDWILTTLAGQPVPEGIVTAEVSDGNQVSGSAGCNQYTASFTTSGDSIQFSDEIATTRMACADPLMQLESAYLAALGKAASYQVAGENLTLLDSQGNELVTFTKLVPLDLTGTNWEVTSYNNGEGAIISVLPDAPVTSSFRGDSSLVGFSGCNVYSNLWYTDNFAIDVTFGGQTRYSCSDAIMLQEALFQAAFGMAGVYKVLGDSMEFRNSAGELIMTFQRLEDLSLTGPNWLLQSLNDQQDALVVPISGTELNLTFNEDGTAGGSSGCNTYSGSYQATDTDLTFGPLASTMMACAEDIMNQEAAFLSFLAATTNYEIQGNYLLLKDADGRVLLLFRGTLPE